ncbi:MAG: HNH endonuclease [Sphingobacteriaceae bacterium]|nr:HNH endonuclease [Sphingobacteriaceae bacterium]
MANIEKYETDLTGYENLKHYINGELDQRTFDSYKINIQKCRVINVKNNRIIQTRRKNNDYHMLFGSNFHRIIYQHVHGPIANALVVDHKDENKMNNRIENLQLLSHGENVKKSQVLKNFKIGDNMQKRHLVKATKVSTNTFEIYKSLYACSKDLNINCGIIKMVCEKLNGVKSGISKSTNEKYIFEYTTEAPTINNTRNMTLHTTDEERKNAVRETIKKCIEKKKQTYICECGCKIKLGSKYLHLKSKTHQNFMELSPRILMTERMKIIDKISNDFL